MEKGFKQLILKTAVFMFAFIAISFVLGQRIVGSSLLYGFDIFIYGGMGKVLLFSILGFVILYREKLSKLKSYDFEIKDGILVLVGIVLAVAFYILELNIESIPVNFINRIWIHLLFLGIFGFLLVGVFGIKFVKDFFRKFKKEIAYFLIFGIVVYSLMWLVWQAWPILSLLVMKIDYFLLNFFGIEAQVLGERILKVGDFSAQIGEACSGVFSIFIFASLYLFFVLLDWKKFNKKKIILVFVPAVVGAFFVNVFRVFLLMIFGAFVSREIALGLYHSYVGMIFFLIYFSVFWGFLYNWMKK